MQEFGAHRESVDTNVNKLCCLVLCCTLPYSLMYGALFS
jgi:hypothetical protein